jgi:uncharacterized protein
MAMTRCALGLVLGLLLAGGGWAQQSTAPNAASASEAARATGTTVAKPAATPTTANVTTPAVADGPDAPASKEDVERYLEIMHARDMMKQVMAVMSKQAREMAEQQLAKSSGELPNDAQERLMKRMDDWIKAMPLDEMLDAMIPVYQKHWTKGDVNNLIAFYSTPTGQKMLTEMPQTMAEGMQAMRPIMEKQMNGMRAEIEQEVAQLKKEYEDGHGKAKEPGGK